jgi:hypothetical protein
MKIEKLFSKEAKTMRSTKVFGLAALIVLLLSSMANAALSLVVGGVDVGSEIIISTSDTIWIGVYDDTGGTMFNAAVVINDDPSSLANGSWTGGNNYYTPPAISGGYNYYYGYLSGYGDMWYLVNSEPSTNVPGIGLQADYKYHADDIGSAVIKLLAVDPVTVLDTLTIHQGAGDPCEIELLFLLTPNGGEALVAGSTYEISWDTEGTISTVLIEYSTNNGGNWTGVDPPNVGNSGSYNWTVPWLSSGQCLVQVSDASDPCTSDISDAVFTIRHSQILTVQVEPTGENINTVDPNVGQHTYSYNSVVDLNAIRFVECPNVRHFDHWEGDVVDPNSPNTTVIMDANQIVTAVFVDGRECGDECHPDDYFGDYDHNCIINVEDFAQFAFNWLVCTKPECD